MAAVVMTKDKSIPNLDNATPMSLVDEIGRMRMEAARLKFLDGLYKQALEARISKQQLEGTALISGTHFVGKYKEVTQERIDGEAVKEYFKDDPKTLRKLMKPITFKQLSTDPVPFPDGI